MVQEPGGQRDDREKKVLILIVAYNAEKTISQVLARIPADRLPPHTEVLITDDSSADRTFETARANRDRAAGLALTVLRNPENQGYGGNQKIGYQYAIEKGFDVVALLHGDGQYAPEKLPDLIEPVLTGRADACFGSRMMPPGAARRQGMPLYKYVGNRILTRFQNGQLKSNLSEFHSGYRVYAVGALEQVPFRYNTNDFHFDTEIIIQFLMRGLRIVELPIPTYYGDEICHVNGMAYAWNVTVATLASRIHRLGILYQRRFDVWGDEPVYTAKMGYPSSHAFAVDDVPAGASVLDLACGPGHVASRLRDKGCRVTGVDRAEPDPSAFDAFVRHDLDEARLPPGLGTYDVILCLDALEHLRRPERLMALLRTRCCRDGTRLLLSVPNVGFFPVRLGLLFGQFNYGRQGILDLTHMRLFTFRSFRRLLEQEGYRIVRMRGVPAPYPKALGDNFLSRILLRLNALAIRIRRGMFAYQIYVEAVCLPPVERLLARTLASTRDRTDPAGERSERAGPAQQ